MMKELSIDDMFEGKTDKYSLAVAVAKIAREITDRAMVQGDSLEEKAVVVAAKKLENHEYAVYEAD